MEQKPTAPQPPTSSVGDVLLVVGWQLAISLSVGIAATLVGLPGDWAALVGLIVGGQLSVRFRPHLAARVLHRGVAARASGLHVAISAVAMVGVGPDFFVEQGMAPEAYVPTLAVGLALTFVVAYGLSLIGLRLGSRGRTPPPPAEGS